MNVVLSARLVVLSLLLNAVSGQLTQADKDAILAKHNSFRSAVQPIATNMEIMVWNEELSQVAQNFSEQCVFEHNGDRVSQQRTFTSVGENVALDTRESAPDTNLYITLVTAWYDEVADYNYSTNSCSDVCGHYTQVVWATSSNVGCGATLCMGQGVLLFCNYGPAGNFIGQSPYMSGNDSCSACPGNKPYCSNNLCTATAPPPTTRFITTPPTTDGSTDDVTTRGSAGLTTPSTVLVVMAMLCAVTVKLVI